MFQLKYQWLNQYRELNQEIEYLKWSLNKSKLELTRWIEGDLVDVKITNESKSAQLEESIEEMQSFLNFLENKKSEMVKLINCFDGLDNQILKLKYVDGKTLEEIAEELGYSDSHIRKVHSQIVKTCEIVQNVSSMFTHE